MNQFRLILAGKAARVMVSSALSVMIPVYLAIAGYSPFLIGVVLAAILAGNAGSNLLVTWLGARVGVRRMLLGFSLLMAAAGALLYYSGSLGAVLAAAIVGNISTTGTEAGPFQSVEAGILPGLARGRVSRAFGTYNMVGYAASSVGALASSTPAYFGGQVSVFRALFLAFAAAGVLLFFVYARLGTAFAARPDTAAKAGVQKSGRGDLVRLSSLFSLDAFGGSMVSQFVLSFWFSTYYGVPLKELGIIFLVTNMISAASALAAGALAERLGNLRTMFYTHVTSNLLLVAIPVSGSLAAAVSFLFMRQSLSQMDVPTRQAFMADLFRPEDLVSANAVTNTARTAGSVAGGPVTAALIASGALSLPIIAGGVAKLVYDATIFATFRKRAR
jgi:MFS family permease